MGITQETESNLHEFNQFYKQYSDDCDYPSYDIEKDIVLYLLSGAIISFENFNITKFEFKNRSFYHGENCIYFRQCSQGRSFPEIVLNYKNDDHNYRDLASIGVKNIDPTKLQTLLNSPVHSPIQVVLDLLTLYAKNENTKKDWENYDLAYRDIQRKLKEGEKVMCMVYFDSQDRFLGLIDQSVQSLLPGRARLATPNDSIPFSKVKIIGTPDFTLHNYTLSEEIEIAKYIYNAIPIKNRTIEESEACITQQYNAHKGAFAPPACSTTSKSPTIRSTQPASTRDFLK